MWLVTLKGDAKMIVDSDVSICNAVRLVREHLVRKGGEDETPIVQAKRVAHNVEVLLAEGLLTRVHRTMRGVSVYAVHCKKEA